MPIDDVANLSRSIARRARAIAAAAWFAAGWLAPSCSGSAHAADNQLCRRQADGERSYMVCTVDIRRDHLALFEGDAAGQAYASFDRLAASLAQAHRRVLFAMNAGMYEADLAPVGLLVENGQVRHPVATGEGDGNFFLKPNGVFYFGRSGLGILETGAFLAARPNPEFATQSGPLLVAAGRLHPRLQPDGSSLKIRNGVGVRDAHTAIFAISEQPVSFYQFATFFRDRLDCPDALYLDGTVSALYAPDLGRTGQIRPLGPMIGVTVP